MITLYVSPTGSDANDGFGLDTPLATLGAASDLLEGIAETHAVVLVESGALLQNRADEPLYFQKLASLELGRYGNGAVPVVKGEILCQGIGKVTVNHVQCRVQCVYEEALG